MSKTADFIVNDYLGTTYTVEVYNENPTYVQPVVHFNHLEMRMVWDKDDKENLWGIYRHRIELTTLIELSNEQVFLNDIIAAKENDIWCTVTRTIGETDTEIFRGYLLMDTITIENRPRPLQFSFTFTDSLGQASEVDYSVNIYNYIVNLGSLGSIVEYTYKRITDIIQACLQDLKINEIYSTNDAFRIISSLKPDGFSSLGGAEYLWDYMDVVALPSLGWYDEEGEEDLQTVFTPITVESVLTELCRLFNAIFYYHEGLYHFENLDSKLNATNDAWVYKTTRTNDPPLPNGVIEEDYVSQRVEIDHSDYKILAGGNITFLPPVRRIKCNYKLKSGNYLIGTLFDDDHFTTLQEIVPIDVELDGSAPLTSFKLVSYFKNTIDVKVDIYNEYPMFTLYQYTIKVNDKYLKRKFTGWLPSGKEVYTDVEWSTGAGYYEVLVDNYSVYTESYSDAILEHIVTIEETIPESGTLELLIEMYGLVFNSGNTKTDVPRVDAEITEWLNLHNYLYIYNAQELTDTQVSYTATNDTNNLKKIEYNGLFLEYGQANTRYKVVIWDDLLVKSTNGWSIGEGSVEYLQMLTLRSQTEFRQTMRRMYNISILQYATTYLTPAMLIQYDSSPINENLIMRLEHDCRTAETQLELMQFEKGSDPVVYDINTGVDIKKIKDAPKTIFGGFNPDPVFNYIKTTKVIVPSDTEIHITGLKGNYFEGDVLEIWYYSEGVFTTSDRLVCMLSADANNGDLILNVFEVNPDFFLPIGSRVEFYARPTFRNIYYPAQINYNFTNITLDPKYILPDETILSENAIRRKIQVRLNGAYANYIHINNPLVNYADFRINKSTNTIYFKQSLSNVSVEIDLEM